MSKPKNVVMMVCDSLRYDSVKLSNAKLPYLDNNAIQFSEARSAGCWTLPATSSLFTGLMPHQHGATAQSRCIREDVPTLAEKMKEAGYKTYQVTANIVTTEIFGVNRGFDETRRIWKMVDPKFNNLQKMLVLLGKPRLRKKILSKDFLLQKMSEDLEMSKTWLQNTFLDIFEEARKIIKSHENDEQGAFIFINLMETHFPYHISPTFSLDSNGIVNKLKEVTSLYHMVNQTFLKTGKEHINKDMLETLKGRQRKAWESIAPYVDDFCKEIHTGDNNYMVFGADHGENFGDTGWTYHFSNVTDAGTKVPLYILPNQKSDHKEVHAPVSTRNVYHTLLDAVGHKDIDGPSLVKEAEESKTIMQSFWYNNKGQTLDKYKYNQLCLLIEGKRYLKRNDDWLVAAMRSDYDEPAFIELGKGANPIHDLQLNEKERNEYDAVVSSFNSFSKNIKF